MPFTRLAHPRDIRAVFSERVVAAGARMVVHVRRRADSDPGRVAVVASRKLGGAVVRNRAKRRLRAAVDELGLPAGVDVVVVTRPEALTAPFDVLIKELRTLLQRATARSEARR